MSIGATGWRLPRSQCDLGTLPIPDSRTDRFAKPDADNRSAQFFTGFQSEQEGEDYRGDKLGDSLGSLQRFQQCELPRPFDRHLQHKLWSNHQYGWSTEADAIRDEV